MLEVLGCRLQSLDGVKPDFMRQHLNQLLYTIQWEKRAFNEYNNITTKHKNWLIFCENRGIGQKLVEYLRIRGANCVIVTAGCSYNQVGNQHYELTPESPEQFERLFRELYSHNDEQVSGIVYLWGMLAPPLNGMLQPLHTDQERVSIGALHLIQALATTKQERSPRLWLVTSDVHAIQLQDRASGLLQAPLWGLGRTIVYEHQHLHCTLIDLDAKLSETCLAALCKEIWSDEAEDEVALHGDRRYIARLTHYTLPEKQKQREPLFRSDGTYLITGDLGGIGLRTAQWIIEQGAQHLVLIGRRGVLAEAEATLQAMRETGANICVLKGDVARDEDLEKALVQIRRTMPPLRGIFHSAVVLDDSTLLQINRERFLSVMPPKVNAAWNLHCLTLDYPLDYFVKTALDRI